MHRTHSIRITNTSTRDSLRQRRIEDVRNAFASTMGKEDILPATVIRKRTTIASLEEAIIQEQNTLKEGHQGEDSEWSRSSISLSPASPPIESHPEAQSR
jgi:hypothetical protein